MLIVFFFEHWRLLALSRKHKEHPLLPVPDAPALLQVSFWRGSQKQGRMRIVHSSVTRVITEMGASS